VDTGITILAHESDQRSFQGTLRMEDDSWFVIHTTTGVFVQLKYSNWEIDVEKTYESKSCSLVVSNSPKP